MSRYAIAGVILAVAAMFLAAGCNGATEAAETSSQGRAVRVITAEAGKAKGESVQVSGVVKAEGQVKVAFQLGGLVTEILVAEGDAVSAGQALARIDSVPYSSQRDQALGALKQAQASYALYQEGARSQEIAMAEAQVRSATAVRDQAEADYRRVCELYDEGVVAKQQMDAAESGFKQAREGLEAAEKQLDMAREGARPQELEAAAGAVTQARGALSGAQRQLEYATLRAPSSGTIVWRDLEVGMTAAPGVPVFEIANFNSLQIDSEVPETDLAKLKVGDTAVVAFPALPEVTCTAEVVSIAPQAQSSTRGFPVKLELIDPDPLIAPGLISLVEYSYMALPDAGIRIPRRCIINGGEVFVAENGKAVATKVEILAEHGEYAYVGGIEGGTRILINGQNYVSDGEQINIVDALAIEEITGLSAE